MKISTTTSALFNVFGYEEGIKVAAEAGFDALDMNFITVIDNEEFSEQNFEKTALHFKSLASENGIYFNQAHAPFPSRIYKLAPELNEEYNRAVAPKVIRAIKAAGILGASQIIAHPIDCPDKTEQKKINTDFYNSLIPYAKEYNIKIALENMFTENPRSSEKIVPNVCSFGADLAEYFDALDPKYFTVCLDLGHSGLVNDEAQNAIRTLGGNRLHALHVHDNDYLHDNHTLPYFGKMDWNEIMKALAEIGYDGDFTYEVGDAYLGHFTEEPELMRHAYEFMVHTAKHLVKKFDQYLRA